MVSYGFLGSFAIFGCILLARSSMPIKIEDMFSVVQESQMGNVYGAKQCGGPAKLLEMMVPRCTSKAPCNFPKKEESAISQPLIGMTMMFTKDIEKPGIRVLYGDTTDQSKLKVAGQTSDSFYAVQANGKYLVGAYPFVADPEDKGKTYLVKVEVFDTADNSTQICAEAEIQF